MKDDLAMLGRRRGISTLEVVIGSLVARRLAVCTTQTQVSQDLIKIKQGEVGHPDYQSRQRRVRSVADTVAAGIIAGFIFAPPAGLARLISSNQLSSTPKVVLAHVGIELILTFSFGLILRLCTRCKISEVTVGTIVYVLHRPS